MWRHLKKHSVFVEVYFVGLVGLAIGFIAAIAALDTPLLSIELSDESWWLLGLTWMISSLLQAGYLGLRARPPPHRNLLAHFAIVGAITALVDVIVTYFLICAMIAVSMIATAGQSTDPSQGVLATAAASVLVLLAIYAIGVMLAAAVLAFFGSSLVVLTPIFGFIFDKIGRGRRGKRSIRAMAETKAQYDDAPARKPEAQDSR